MSIKKNVLIQLEVEIKIYEYLNIFCFIVLDNVSIHVGIFEMLTDSKRQTKILKMIRKKICGMCE